MIYFSPLAGKFFRDLRDNNNKIWFDENKKIYNQEVKEPFIRFIRDLLALIIVEEREYATVDPKKSIFRINRDIRFSKDKSPYKLSAGAHIGRYSKDSDFPRYYLHFLDNQSFMAAGCRELTTQNLKNLRLGINANYDTFCEITQSDTFLKYNVQAETEKSKKLPKELDDVGDSRPILYNKLFYCSAKLSEEIIYGNDLLNYIFEIYRSQRPYLNFISLYIE